MHVSAHDCRFDNNGIIPCLIVSLKSLTVVTKMAQSAVKFETYKESDDIEDYFERLEMFSAMTGVKSGILAHWFECSDLRSP